jgi:hypothetical protein
MGGRSCGSGGDDEEGDSDHGVDDVGAEHGKLLFLRLG